MVRRHSDYQFVKCHMMLEIKMGDFRRKAHLVAGGHATQTLEVITYSSVVMRETVCVALTTTALHDLDVKPANILNAYVMASNIEKIWAVLVLAFGNNAGKSAIIVSALYRLKSAGGSSMSCTVYAGFGV